MLPNLTNNIFGKSLTFVIPWYGKDLLGGAETLCRRTVENLSKSGVNVEVFTTCSKEFLSDWTNFFSEGTYDINGVAVKRFSVDERDRNLFDSINYKLMNNIEISKSEEEKFIQNNINSSKMIKTIKDEKDKRIFLFIPYLYGTTYFGCQTCPEKSILIPCLHDESYAVMNIFKDLFTRVKGIVFNSGPEKKLAKRIYHNLPPNTVIGAGVDTNIQPNPIRFNKKFKLDKFLLYTGRKDPQKNLPTLINYFCKFVEKNGPKFDLVITGPGNLQIPNEFKNHIKSMMLSKEDLYDAYAAAFLTCQPSLYESFSYSIMESWLCSTPVMVNGNCDVTRDHCVQSNGGLYFTNYKEFEECVNFFIQNDNERKIMAINGRKYILDNFDWKIITQKYVTFIQESFNLQPS
jgi:glycosyltransferase involved in cell wall biosynthesis